MAKAQLLCLKPSTEGLIYPNFSREVHMLTAAQMAEKITGEKFDPFLNKEGLLQVMKQWGLKEYAGTDFGYSHNFANVAAMVDGMRAFVIDVIAEPGLEPNQMIDVLHKHYDALGISPAMYPDRENPMLINILKKAGFKMRDWNKGPGSVGGGIDTVRLKLRPTMGEAQVFLLKDDPGCELLAKRLSQYHWKINAAGDISDVPDDEDDDECDAFRYVIMNVFGFKSRLIANAPQATSTEASKDATNEQHIKDAWAKIMAEHGINQGGDSPNIRGKSGGFRFDFS
jgi:hypothetical protein